MGRFHSLQNNATAGELSPRLTRTDLSKYSNGYRTISNAYPIPQGALTRRPGTKYHSETDDMSAPSRLIPFVSSDQSVFALELGDEFIRPMTKDLDYMPVVAAVDMSGSAVWEDNSTGTASISYSSGTITLTGAGASIAKATQEIRFCGAGDYTLTVTAVNNTVTIKIGTELSSADLYSSTQAVGTGTHTFTVPLGESTSIWIEFSNAANDTRKVTQATFSAVPAELLIPSPFESAELFEVSYAQSADVMYFAHGNYQPRTLSHFSDSQWEMKKISFDDGPYIPENTVKAYKLTPSATTGTVTITATGGHRPFSQDDVGKPLRLRQKVSGNYIVGWGFITVFTDDKHVTVEVDADYPFGSTSATPYWRTGAWSDQLGWPEIVTFQENRICFAASLSNPITIWASQSSGYDRLTVLYGPTKSDNTVTAELSITVPLAQKDVQRILWMSPGPTLAVGTVAGEWVVEGPDSSTAWSPTNNRPTLHTSRGSKEGSPGIRIETSVLYVQQKGKVLREFTFNFTKNALQSNDLTILADHILLDVVEEIAYVQDPHSYVVARMATGELRFLTYVGDEDVGGWSRHVIGGEYDGGIAVVESIAVLPDYEQGYDALWMIVKRTINGSTVRYIEIMQPPFYQGDKADAWYLDCALQTSGSGLTEIDDLDHLEDATVGVYVDGAVRADAEVDFGTIGLEQSGDKVLVGFRYTSQLITIPLDWTDKGPRSAALGTSLGKKQMITTVDLHVYETGPGVRVGPDSEITNDIEVRQSSQSLDAAPGLLSGWVSMPIGGYFDSEAVLYFTVDDPVPFTLLEYSPRGNVNEN